MAALLPINQGISKAGCSPTTRFPFSLPHHSLYNAVKRAPSPRWSALFTLLVGSFEDEMKRYYFFPWCTYLDVYTLAVHYYLLSKYILSPGFPFWLLLTLGPFLFIASPSRQLYSYRAKAGHFKIPLKTLKGKSIESLVTIRNLFSQSSSTLCSLYS